LGKKSVMAVEPCVYVVNCRRVFFAVDCFGCGKSVASGYFFLRVAPYRVYLRYAGKEIVSAQSPIRGERRGNFPFVYEKRRSGEILSFAAFSLGVRDCDGGFAARRLGGVRTVRFWAWAWIYPLCGRAALSVRFALRRTVGGRGWRFDFLGFIKFLYLKRRILAETVMNYKKVGCFRTLLFFIFSYLSHQSSHYHPQKQPPKAKR